ncbi:class I SAM-dependent methyltransferase [Catenuloplanes atrovinosus]|uniref:C-methyltransferase n=1 Tax=Catenuloplanes atrovinosus TaxID=137266 RepID=A0AAE3YQG8_9ACTN|nr:class I SAM-dependent methyltransferase [Catenuloplanes atrovinosus]MDR7276790.1 C-methyltransferase [Catenuloplanes atrovinosus]
MTSTLTRRDISDMMQAYKKTSLLRTGVGLGVFDALADGPLGADDLAARRELHPRGARILLDALAAIGLVEPVDGRFALAPAAAEHLVSTRPDYLGGMVKVMSSDWEWDALRDLDGAVRAGGTVLDTHAETPGYRYWEDFAEYATKVARPTAEVMAEVLAPWAKERETLDVLDVACGHGMYGYTMAAHNPHARVWSLDWENVLAVTAQHAAAMGVADRASFIPGDMFTEPLGGPYDLVLLTNVTHHFSEQRVTELVTRLGTVVRPGGRLVIVGFTTGDEPPALDPAPYLFSVLMLVWTHEGESHSVAAYDRALAAGGFGPATVHPTDLPFRILVADRKD